MTTNLTDPIFTDKDAAREYLERARWANGVYCPHCSGTERIRKLSGESHRPGLYQCGQCRQQFTVTVGTVFERSKVPLNKWLLASFLMASSKKGISAHQLHRTIDVTYKTAWFMFHRIREAMRNDSDTPLGGKGGMVEVDETYIGRKKAKKPKGQKAGRGPGHKYAVLSLVDRETGEARSMVMDKINAKELAPILRENIAKEAILVTDEHGGYFKPGKSFAGHRRLRHRMGEYVRRKEPEIHTNTIEGFFSIFKRGMKGVYQHCGRQHLHRYAAEFAFRYTHRIAKGTDDTARARLILKGAEGRRLTYRRIGEGASA